ncbi:Alpha/Beta hydrolase protein [Chiua virens]|nr:Alpha/Beta hydrolase protein [Chiua virens]
MLALVSVCLALISLVYAAAINDIRPLVVWHGMGDSYASTGMVQFESEVKKMHPGIFVHSVYLDQDAKADQRAGFYGNVNEQLAIVAEQLNSIPELSRGFDAIGFSQGGQFLRGHVERNNTPPVYNLITFGSQHMGVSDLPVCGTFDLLCQIARRAAKAGVYTQWAQDNLVQAQYFRDPEQLSLYKSLGSFLADINNEVFLASERRQLYAENFASLRQLVLVLFTEDETVVPKESAWFGSEAPSQDARYESDMFAEQKYLGSVVQEKVIVPMKQHPLYEEDWIGLRTLDERGAVALVACPGRHMYLTGCWESLAEKWIGGPFP